MQSVSALTGEPCPSLQLSFLQLCCFLLGLLRRPQVSKWLAGDEYLVLDGPLRSSGGAPDPAWALQGSGGSYNAPTGYGYGSYDDARGCSDGQRGRNTASPCFGPSGGYARYRGSSQQQQRQYGGGYGRSRSMEAEGAGQARWQAQRGYHDFRDRASSMDWEDEEGGCGGEDEQEEAGPWGDDEEGCEGGWGGGWCDGGAGLLEERRLEDMESLLGRILLHRWGASWLALCGCRAGLSVQHMLGRIPFQLCRIFCSQASQQAYNDSFSF